MLGIRITTVSLLLCAALGAQTIWMPLEEGNVWVYRATGAGDIPALEVRVERTTQFASETWSLVRGFPQGPVWLRNADGRILMWDEQTSTARVWLDTAGEEGPTSPTGVDPCNAWSRIQSRNANYTGPIGEFNYALHVRYGFGGCADAGIDSDFLLPWIGIVSRTQQTIAGPRRYDLVYARLGVTVISAPELSFSLSLDRSVYTANLMPPIVPENAIPRIHARITLRNTTPDPVKLEFASGQIYEMVLWNDQGKVVWRYSDGRAFTQAFHSITVARGERTWTETIRLTDSIWFNATPLPAGRYVLECWLTTTEGRTFTASAPLTLNHVH